MTHHASFCRSNCSGLPSALPAGARPAAGWTQPSAGLRGGTCGGDGMPRRHLGGEACRRRYLPEARACRRRYLPESRPGTPGHRSCEGRTLLTFFQTAFAGSRIDDPVDIFPPAVSYRETTEILMFLLQALWIGAWRISKKMCSSIVSLSISCVEHQESVLTNNTFYL